VRPFAATIACLCAVLLTMAPAGPTGAQDLAPILKAGPQSQTQAKAGAEFPLKLSLVVTDGYHINSTKPEDDSLLPTRLELKKNPVFRLLKVDWPTPHLRKFPYTDSKIPVYEGKIHPVLHLAAKAGAPAREYRLEVTISYQGCTDTACLMPDELTLQIPVRLVP
jgi:hypothetical protein